eukprot:CAMPEP_0182594122 /NCGR_PEP_ID=MMETSP1324-20130603/79477_1 /TAXON_ID=236786 /ORGANISM="Florenciella sp., Strain RCC1587" /LENGTH=71 /DNA_ID=CAMNT_0024811637 /DNA_START=54 /DNA_END=266 /DNA_ORIENTATION=-
MHVRRHVVTLGAFIEVDLLWVLLLHRHELLGNSEASLAGVAVLSFHPTARAEPVARGDVQGIVEPALRTPR